MEDVFKTIVKSASHEIKVKGSRFIGFAMPAQERQTIEQEIAKIKKQYHDATHHCFAYRLGFGDQAEFRYYDDGEPSGTAGKPILDALDGRHVTNSLCIVVRYFGGTKLGTGGLARAYGQCAKETLDISQVVEKYMLSSASISFNYNLMGVVMPLLSKYQCQIIETLYGEQTTLHLLVRKSLKAGLFQDLMNQTAGRIQFIEES